MLMLIPLAALPVIIHMIHRQKYKITDFSTLLFFDRSHKYNVFRRLLRHKVLMGMRILILLLLVLAFTRLNCSNVRVGDRLQAVAMVVDCSVSTTQMFDDDGQESMLDFAKRQARASLSELSPGSMVCVVRNTRTPELVLAPTADRDAADQAIAALAPDFTEGSSWEAVDLALDTLGSVRSPARQVLVFTDLQRSAWATNGIAEGRSASHAGIAVKFVALRPRSRENCAIVGMEAQQAPVTLGRPARFALMVRNFGSKAAKNLRIEGGLGAVEGAERVAAVQTVVDIPPRGTVLVNCFLTFSIPGPHEIWFRLPDDAIPADNQWSAAVSVADTVPVLCLGNEDGSKTNNAVGDLFYLANALVPSGKANNLSVTVLRFDEFAKSGLYGYNCVFMTLVKSLGNDELNLIRQYVRGGGGLVVFPGADTDEATLKRLLGEDGEALLPVQVEGHTLEAARVAEVDFSRSVLADMAPVLQELRGIFYTSRYKLRPRSGDARQVETLAVFDDGAPAIIEARHGLGRCILFAGGCGQPGTDLPLRAVFPALVRELAYKLATPVRNTTSFVRPGEMFVGSFEEAEIPAQVLVTGPGNQRRAVAVKPGRNDYGVAVTETAAPGYYRLQTERGDDGGHETALGGFAANLTGADADLEPASPEQMGTVYKGAPLSVASVENSALRTGLIATDKRDLMRMLLLLALALVAVENIVSWVTK
ncbi:MAG: VWA domain-containing protein [Lentisphaerae bacterium]|nr:VWA domain-containing protein [Lentisphaerota bacterium]